MRSDESDAEAYVEAHAVESPDRMFPSMTPAASPGDLKNRFLAWQCRIRQYAVRRNEGRPSSGMRPGLWIQDREVAAVNVLVVRAKSEEVTREFRYMVQKTLDPRDRYSQALRFFSEYYYQTPGEFDEELTAVFAVDSALADRVAGEARCRLVFDQGNQRYTLHCSTRLIEHSDPKYQTSYWHNHLFNSSMPGAVKVVGFKPDWARSAFRPGSPAPR